ncbi:MAG: TonB-dependent receptor [Cytophagales bacterium]|nr:TonB-dependent receptor [Cytophagales bacterium]
MNNLYPIRRLSFFSLLWLLIAGQAFAQQLTVTGKVLSTEDGESMPGVSVQIKGTTQGTITDYDGNFAIVCSSSDVLLFSFVGFLTEEVEVKGQNIIEVLLKPDVKSLEEVVVVGYGTQNKREVTGAIAKVSGQELVAAPLPSFEAGLQGRASGVQVIQSSGLAGAGSQIRVRGTGSITAGGDPLYVIDGMPLISPQGERVGAANTNPLNTINPNDIESVEILKDASATAIYGSRGANGVVLVTTKRGKSGKPIFDVSYRVTASRPTNTLDLLDNSEYIAVMQEAQENDFIYGRAAEMGSSYQWPLSTSGVSLPGGFSHAQAMAVNTDWQDEVIQTGFSHNVDLSMTQGADNFSSYVGVSYSSERSFLKEDKFDRLNGRINLDYSPNESVSVGTTTGFTRSTNFHAPVSWNGGLGTAQSGAIPFWPVRNADGSYYVFPSSLNPVLEINNLTRRTRQLRTLANLYANIEPTENLSLRFEGGLDYIDRKYDDYRNKVLNTNPAAYQANYYDFSWNLKGTASYNFSIGDNHRLKLLAGAEILNYRQHSKNINATFTDPAANPGAPIYKDPSLPLDTLANGSPNPNLQRATNPVQEFVFLSYFGRLNYVYKDKYLLNATFRADGSSRFGQNNRFGYFPSASLGWIVSDESFWGEDNIITSLKFKVGYGRTGNAEISNYAQYGTTDVNIQSNYGPPNSGRPNKIIVQNNLANPDISWETTDAFDAGLEFGLWDDRISGEVAYYYKKTKDLFLNVAVPTSSGWATVIRNIGKLRNTGAELSINSSNFVGDFIWRTSLNMSFNRNKVLDVGNAGPDALGGSGDTRVLEGFTLGVNYLVKTLYVDSKTGRPVYEGIRRDENGNIVERFETFVYNPDRDRQVVGKPIPDVFGGLNNFMSYKNFELSFLINFSLGSNIYDDAEKFHMNNIGTWNLRRKILDRWRKPGDNTDVPRLTLDEAASGISKARNTSEYLHSGDYVRLKNVTLAYNFPSAMLEKWKLQSMRVYVTGTNLLTITDFEGLDPEIFRDIENAQQKNLSPNVTYLTPPQASTISFGVSVTF